MSKIRELNQEEAGRLRLLVCQQFMRRQLNGRDFQPKSFKGAYEEMRDDIIGVVQHAESSVSLNRLRKLFYYTDPAVCSPKQLEKASFGRDFIEALEQYVGENKSGSPLPHIVRDGNVRTWKKGWMLLLLLPMTGLIIWLFQPGLPKSWREDFKSTNVDSLRGHGFGWLDFDSVWWPRQLRDSALTLYTHQGDYWVKPHEKREIKNMLYRELRGDCFSVIAKIDDFDPQHNCQQLAIFLFDEHLSRETHVRVSFVYWGGVDSIGIQHTTTNYQESGQVTDVCYSLLRNLANADPKINTCWLKLFYNDGELSVYQKVNHVWSIWGQCAQPFKLKFKPAFVGIAAFQGWTNDDGSPRDADPIPVFVDYLQVEACDK